MYGCEFDVLIRPSMDSDKNVLGTAVHDCELLDSPPKKVRKEVCARPSSIS